MEESESSLEPCPFCGSKNVTTTVVATTPPYQTAQVHCRDCFAQGPLIRYENPTHIAGAQVLKNIACARWNNRMSVQA